MNFPRLLFTYFLLSKLMSKTNNQDIMDLAEFCIKDLISRLLYLSKFGIAQFIIETYETTR
jgi:hypothetical protein